MRCDPKPAAEIQRIIANLPGTRVYLVGLGEAVKLTVLLFAPVGPGRGGHYAKSFYSKWVGGADPHVRVGSRSFKAWWIEFGAIRPHSVFHARAPFRRALIQHGIKFTAARKNRA
jgi:hypothetical protein